MLSAELDRQEKMPSAADQWKCLKLVLLTHFTVELPQIWGFHPMAEYFGMATHQVPFPSWGTVAYQVALFFVLEDAWHYWAHRCVLHHYPVFQVFDVGFTHRTMHRIPVLYKRIHKLHHEFSAPFGLAAEYAHPIEILILGTGTVGGPILWCWLSGGNLHLFTMCVFFAEYRYVYERPLFAQVHLDHSSSFPSCRCAFWIRSVDSALDACLFAELPWQTSLGRFSIGSLFGPELITTT